MKGGLPRSHAPRIRGHAGDPNNQRVDRLARAAALSAG